MLTHLGTDEVMVVMGGGDNGNIEVYSDKRFQFQHIVPTKEERSGSKYYRKT